jgi:predicted PurR-regulated permease PerM
MGRSLDLHPVVVMVALAVGGVLGGIVGAFLAVPAVAVAVAGIGGWTDAPGPARPRPAPEGAGERRVTGDGAVARGRLDDA